MKTFTQIGRALLFLVALIAASSSRLHAQQRSARELESSCHDFVQGFYDWYVPKALQEKSEPAWNLALRYKKSVFTQELFRRLSQDSEAQAKAKGEIVGIDFDPFLNSQDPSEHFTVQNVSRRGDRFWVEVRGIQAGEMHERVTPELVLSKDGQWTFVNFHYGSTKSSADEDLLTILKLPQR
jgi:hypothetical protein